MTVDTKTGIRVFVYGTLKRGRSNHGVLAKAEFLGRCKLPGRHTMVDLRYYPGMVFNPKATEDTYVLGEVYRVSKEQLDTLDIIEGHPDYYVRTKVQTPWKGAWCYFLPQEYLDKASPVDPVNGVQVWRPSDEETEYVKSVASGI